MSQTLPDVEHQGDSLALQEPMTVLLAYRDAEHEKLGTTFWQNLSRYLEDVRCERVTEWKFEMIASATLNPLATTEAQEASVILLAAHSGEELPAKVTTWLEHWVSCQSTRGFLVVLLTENFASSANHWPDYPHLALQAKQAGTELIVCPIGISTEQRSVYLFSQSWRVRPTGLAPLGDLPAVAALFRAHQKAQVRR